MTKNKVMLQELLDLRASVEQEIAANDPGKKIAKIDKQITEAQELARQLENERKVEEMAKKRARAREVYLETVEKLVSLNDSLNELAKYSLIAPRNRLPIMFVRQVGQTIAHIRFTDPEALGLPPRPSPEEVARKMRDDEKKRLQTLATEYRKTVKEKGTNWQEAEKRLEQLESALKNI